MMDAHRNKPRKPSVRGWPSFDEHDTSFIPSPGVKITLRRYVNVQDNNSSDEDLDTAISVPTAPPPRTIDDSFEAIVSGADNADVDSDDNAAKLTSDHHENVAEALEAVPIRKPVARINDIRNILDGDDEDEDCGEKDFQGGSGGARESAKSRSAFENKEREAKQRRLEEGRIYAEERRRKLRQEELIAQKNAKKEKEDRQQRLRRLQEESRSRVKSVPRNTKQSHELLSHDQQQQQAAVKITTCKDIRDSQSVEDPSTDLSFLSQGGDDDETGGGGHCSDDHSNKENEAYDASARLSRPTSAALAPSSFSSFKSGSNIRVGSVNTGLKTDFRSVKTVDHFDRLRKLHENIVARFEAEDEGNVSAAYGANSIHAVANRGASSPVHVTQSRPVSASHSYPGLDRSAQQGRPPLPPTQSTVHKPSAQAHDRNPSVSLQAHSQPRSPSRSSAAAPRTHPSPGLRCIRTVGDKKRTDRRIGNINNNKNNTVDKRTISRSTAVTRHQVYQEPLPARNKELEEMSRVLSSRENISPANANQYRFERLKNPISEVEKLTRSRSLVIAKDATDVMDQVDRMASMLKQLTLDLEARTAAAVRESVLSIPSYAEVKAARDCAVEEKSLLRLKEVPNVAAAPFISSTTTAADTIAVSHKAMSHDDEEVKEDAGKSGGAKSDETLEGPLHRSLVPTGEALYQLAPLTSNRLAADLSARDAEYAAKADVGPAPSSTDPANRSEAEAILPVGSNHLFGGEGSGYLFRGGVYVSRHAEEDDAVLVDDDGDFNDGDVAFDTIPTSATDFDECTHQLVSRDDFTRLEADIHAIRRANEEEGEDVEDENVYDPDKVVVPPTVSIRGIRHPQGDDGQIDRFSISRGRDSNGTAVAAGVDPLLRQQLGLFDDKRDVLDRYGSVDAINKVLLEEETARGFNYEGDMHGASAVVVGSQPVGSSWQPSLRNVGALASTLVLLKASMGGLDDEEEDRGWKGRLKREQERHLRAYARGQVSTRSPALYQQDDGDEDSTGSEDDTSEDEEENKGYIRRDHRIISIVANEIFQQRAAAAAAEAAVALQREAQLLEEEKQREARERRLKHEKRENARYQQTLHQDHLRQLQSASTSNETPALTSRGPSVEIPGGKSLFDDSVLAGAAPSPEIGAEDAEGEENPDPRLFWDSLLTRPLPLIARRPSLSSSASAAGGGSSVLSREEVASIHRLTGAAPAINRVDGSDTGLAGPESFSSREDIQTTSLYSQPTLLDRSRLTPSDMRIKLMEELQRQDEIFKHAVDLAELEQAHTLHTAGDLVRRIVSQANQEALAIKMEQELARQRHAYDASLAVVAASAELQLQQQSLARDEEMISLQARLLKEQERQYEILRMDMDLAAQTLDEAARLVDTEGRAAMYAATTAITQQLAPSPLLHYGPPVIIQSAPAAAESTVRVTTSPQSHRSDTAMRRTEFSPRSQAEVDDDVYYDDAIFEEASLSRSQSASTSAAILASPNTSKTAIHETSVEDTLVLGMRRHGQSLQFDSTAQSIEDGLDRCMDRSISSPRLHEISEDDSVPPSLSPSPSPPKRTIGVLAGDKPGKSSTQEGGVKQALKHEQQQGERVEEYLDDDAGYSSAEFADDDFNRSVKEESHVNRTSFSASSPKHTAVEVELDVAEELGVYDDEDFVIEDQIEDNDEIADGDKVAKSSQIQSSYVNYSDDFDAEATVISSPLNKSKSRLSSRAVAAASDHTTHSYVEDFVDDGDASPSSPMRGKSSYDRDPDLLGDVHSGVSSLEPRVGAMCDNIDSSQDTLDELEKSIEARKKRVEVLQNDLRRVKSDREKLEVVRVKTVENSRLSSLEDELKRQLMEEKAALQSDRARALCQSIKESPPSLKTLDVQTRPLITDESVAAEDVQGSIEIVKTEEEKGFKDKQMIARWVKELSPPEELEHEVALEEGEIDGDSFASEVNVSASSSPSLNRKTVIPASSKTSSAVLLQRAAEIEDQLLSKNIRDDFAAQSIQAVTRGFLTRVKLARLAEEKKRVREELRAQEQAIQGDLCVELEVAAVAEDSVLEDSFASDYDADESQLVGTALLRPIENDALGPIDELDNALSKLSAVTHDERFPLPPVTTSAAGEEEQYDSAFDDSVKSDDISIAESLLSEDETAADQSEAVVDIIRQSAPQQAAGMELQIDRAAAGDMSLFELSADSSTSASITRESRRARTADLTMYLSEDFSQSSSQNQPSPMLGQKPPTPRFSPPTATAVERFAATEGSPGDGDSSDGETVAWGVTHTGASAAVSKWRIDSDSPAIPTVFPMQEIVLDSLSEVGERKHSQPGFEKDATAEAGIAVGSLKRRLDNKKEDLENDDIFGALLGEEERIGKGLYDLAEHTTSILLSRILSEELGHLPATNDIIASVVISPQFALETEVPYSSPVQKVPMEGVNNDVSQTTSECNYNEEAEEKADAVHDDRIQSQSDSSAAEAKPESEDVRFNDDSFASSEDSSCSEKATNAAAVGIASDTDRADDPQKPSINMSASKLSSLGDMPPLSASRYSLGPTTTSPRYADADSDEEESPSASLGDELDKLYDFDASSAVSNASAFAAADLKSLQKDSSVSVAKDACSMLPVVTVLPPERMLTWMERLLTSCDMDRVLERLDDPSFQGTFITCTEFESAVASIQYGDEKEDGGSKGEQVTSWHSGTQSAVFDRLNEILSEIHDLRFADGNSEFKDACIKKVTFPKRLLAKSLPMIDKAVVGAIIRQLREDSSLSTDVASGKKHVLELVMVTIMDGIQEEISHKLGELADQVTDVIMRRLIESAEK